MKLKKVFKKMQWFLSRWMAMEHPGEDIYRLNQFLQLQVKDVYFRKVGNLRGFVWNGVISDYSIADITSKIPAGVCFEKFKIYDYEISNVFSLTDWRRDYKHGITSRIKTASKIDAQNFNEIGDIRYVSTLSRLHHLPFMMLASPAINKNVGAIILQQLKDWDQQNPYLQSINWKSGIEAGIRATNLIFLRKSLTTDNSQAAGVPELIDALIEKHFVFLTTHLSLYSSANNHLLFELMGIFIIAANYQFSTSVYWKDKSYKWLLSELMKQTYKDGFSREQSSHYHAEVMNIFTIVFGQACQSSLAIPFFAINRLEKMAVALSFLLDEKRHLLSIGDSDEGQIIYPYFDNAFSLYNSLFFDVAMLTNNTALNTGYYYDWDLRNYLIWGKKVHALRGVDRSLAKKDKLPEIKQFKYAGYTFFSDGDVRLLFDTGKIGYGKLAAHGHADLLQFLLSVKGQPFIIDPGTYQYHSRFLKYRNYFRGTLAHNTISVNGLDQAKSGGRMIWHTKPDVLYGNCSLSDFTVCASHNGFVKQGAGVTHSRTISYNLSSKTFLVSDILAGTDDYSFVFSLHFSPEVEVKHHNDKVFLYGDAGSVLLQSNSFTSAILISGHDKEIAGWYSPAYNSLVPITTLQVRQKSKGTTTLQMKIITTPKISSS